MVKNQRRKPRAGGIARDEHAPFSLGERERQERRGTRCGGLFLPVALPVAAGEIRFSSCQPPVPDGASQLLPGMTSRVRQYGAAATSVASVLGSPLALRSNVLLHGRGPMMSRSLPVLPLATRRLVLRGDRDFLRALRAAEMAEWEASGGDFAQSATENQPAGGGVAGSKVTLAAAAAGNPSLDLPV